MFSAAALLLLLIVLFLCGCSDTVHAGGNAPKTAVDPLTGTTPVPGANWKDIAAAGFSVSSLRVPSLVKVGGDVFAVAEAEYKEEGGGGEVFIGIASKLLRKEAAAPTDISAADTKLLYARPEGDSDTGGEKATDIMRPTTLVVGDDVYMLLGNYS
ncbi:complement regulatory protein, partial [Trypanosoma conorhini]